MQFVPSNELEASLLKAINEPSHRPTFYQDLAGSTVFIIQHGVPIPNEQEKREMQAGESLQILQLESNGKYYIPIFSSLIRLQPVITGEVAYLGINAMELFKMTRGADLLLNPGSEFCKEFSASEIAELIDGTIGKTAEQRVEEENIDVLIGEPVNYPKDLVESLKKRFAKDKRIKRAWIAQLLDPRVDIKPHTLLALEVTTDFEFILEEIGQSNQGIEIPEPPLDIYQVTGKGELDNYFLRETKPFYARKRFGVF
jgi:hypothetical protein